MSHLVLIADDKGVPHLVNFDHVVFLEPLPDGLVKVTMTGERELLLRTEMQTLANDIAHQKYCDPRGSRR